MEKEDKPVRRNLARLDPGSRELYAYISGEYDRLLDLIERENLPFKLAKLYINARAINPWLEAMLCLDQEAMPANFQAGSRNGGRFPGCNSAGETQTDLPCSPDRQVSGETER
jgi:hypothetical protein